MGLYKLAQVDPPFDPSNRFESSYILNTYVLASYRWIVSLYCFTTLIFKLAYSKTSKESAGESFSYFTNITYWGLAFYFLFAGYHTFQYARYGQAPLQKWPKILQFLHSLYYSTIVLFPFLVTAVYWLVILESPPREPGTVRRLLRPKMLILDFQGTPSSTAMVSYCIWCMEQCMSSLISIVFKK